MHVIKSYSKFGCEILAIGFGYFDELKGHIALELHIFKCDD